MSAATTQHPPIVPPRPSRSPNKDLAPMMPPRPIHRRIERSLSPNPDRFAPSPLNESPFPSKPSSTSHLSIGNNGDIIDRPQSVEMPTVGEEGREYELLTEEPSAPQERSSSPEHTRTVGADLKLHAPRPSLPAQSAKQRVMAVTRTDSDKAASFGIGKPSSEEYLVSSSNRSLKKKASTASQLSTAESYVEDEQGIPEIGQQVPMYPDAGDVQAPSPAPPRSISADGRASRNHGRKTSSTGLPPGSYGLHGHGVVPQDSLERAYYDKHPGLLKKEHTPHHHDRPYDFSMTSADLNKIVRDTASRGIGLATNEENTSTPSEQVGWQAIDETTHVTSGGPESSAAKSPSIEVVKPDARASGSEFGERRSFEETGVIHVDEPHRRRSVMFNDDDESYELVEEPDYNAPILAEDELRKHPSMYDYQAAVEPPSSILGSEDGISRPSSRANSRPTSRPASLYKVSSVELQSTPLEDVEEYQPLFPEDEKANATEAVVKPKPKTNQAHTHRFPSRDIWEDAPDSVYYTAQVSTPDVTEELAKGPMITSPLPREGETPAQAFARHQEELAEKEVQQAGVDSFLPMKNKHKPIWAQHQTHLSSTEPTRPEPGRRFPSRDVWEDVPDSLQLETTVSTPQQELEEAGSPAPQIPQRPTRKSTDPSERPSVPQRPKPKQTSSEEDVTSPVAASATSKPPVIPHRPKPHVPARPAKAGPTSRGLQPAEAAAPPKQKPAVPARPVGSKIAALQAGFMSDLNKKLGLGPQVLKKEEPVADTDAAEQKEKAPLTDARKSRARGPQRRAPAKGPSSSTASKGDANERPVLGFSVLSTLYEIDPEEGDVSLGHDVVPEEKAVASPDTLVSDQQKPEVEPVGPEESVGSEEKSSKEEEEAGEDEIKEENTEVTNEEESPESKSPDSDAEPPTASTEQEHAAPVEEEIKSLATNMAGEPVVTEELKVDKEHDEVEPVKVEES